MIRKRYMALLCSIALTTGTLAGCGNSTDPKKEEKTSVDNTPLEVTIATPQVGEAPKKAAILSWR